MSVSMMTETAEPAGHTRAVTAFFDSEADAEKARADLVSAGISPDAINVLGGQDAEGGSPAEGTGFWHALKSFFIPDEDSFAYAEGVRRGGFALSVRTNEDQYDRALDILDADGAVDIDERQQSWKDEGWEGYRPPDLAPLTADLGRTGDASTAGFGASRAGEDGYASTGALTASGSAEAESRADPTRVGTGADEPGLLNPDFRERIDSGTASMTPPTPTGAQDATLGDNAAVADRATPAYARQVEAEDATLGSPTRSGSEAPAARSTIGSTTAAETEAAQRPAADAWSSRRDYQVDRTRVRGYIIDSPTKTAGSGI